jgi:hypothetical protein
VEALNNSSGAYCMSKSSGETAVIFFFTVSSERIVVIGAWPICNSWVTPNTTVDLLPCWKEQFRGHNKN